MLAYQMAQNPHVIEDAGKSRRWKPQKQIEHQHWPSNFIENTAYPLELIWNTVEQYGHF